jgi:tetratricopeptide (TPR) repeat protein
MENTSVNLDQLRADYRSDPENLSIAIRLGQYYSDHGWYNEALDIYQNALTVHERDYALILEYGNLCFRRKDYKEAAAKFRILAELKPDRIEGWNNLGIVQLQLGDAESARISFEKVLEIEPNNPGALLNMGNYHSNKNENQTARAYFERAVEARPDFADGWYNLGNSFLAVNDYPNALNSYKRALKYQVEFPSALKNLGFAFEKLGEYERALECYMKASDLSKADASIQVNLGSLYLSQRKYDEAKKCFLKAVRLAPNELNGWMGLRRLALLKGDLNTFVRATFAILPRLSEGELAKSVEILFDLNQISKAEELLNQADRLGKCSDELDIQKLLLYHKQGINSEKIKFLYKKLMDKTSVSDTVRKGLARYLLETGEYDKAVQQVNMMENPGNDSYGLLWRALLVQNEVEAAKRMIQSYVKDHPECFDCWFLLAKIEAQSGNTSYAEKLLVRALENGFTDLEEIQESPELKKIFDDLALRRSE